MERVSSLCLVTMVGCLLACGSAGYCGHGHSSHGSTHAASHATPHPAPKHPAAKPPKSKAHKPEAKPKGHDSHQSRAAKPTAKPHGGTPKERASNSIAGGAKSHGKARGHDHDHHHDRDHHHHGHRYWNGHEWVDGVDVDGATVADGSTGVVVPADGLIAPAVVASDTAAPIASAGPQILFSVDPQERDSYDAAAHAAGMSRSEWIRSRLNAAVQQEQK
jgi:hypothetical protein